MAHINIKMNLELETIFAEEFVVEACNLASVDHLADLISIDWSNRATTRLGLATRTTFTITLAQKAWLLISEKERRETVFHEVAHLIAYYEGGIASWGHTPEWRAVMARIGYPEASRGHMVTTALAPLRRRVRRAVAGCSCTYAIPGGTHRSYNGDHFLTLNKATRIKQGETFICRSCGDILELTGQVITI